MRKIFFFLSLFLTSHLYAQITIPTPDHIVVVIFENHSYSEIIGSPAAPHINELVNDIHSALFTQSFALEHPSQPNYLDLFSGCNQGVSSDNFPSGTPFTTDNLGRQLLDQGKTFVTYSEDLPGVGFNGATSGKYARKHNPAANWMGTDMNQIPPETNQPFTSFPQGNFDALPAVCYIIPNQDNDMHNGIDPDRIINADNWLYNHLWNYIEWANTHNSLFILTFDEDDNTEGNRIPTIFSGQSVQAGSYSETIKHYHVLSTMEKMYNLPYACNASPDFVISDCWSSSASVPWAGSFESTISIYPDPANQYVSIQFKNGIPQGNTMFRLFDIVGKPIIQQLLESDTQSIYLGQYPNGIYFYQILSSTTLVKAGKIMVN